MSAAKHTPGPGEHGYRVTPARFCAGCGDDVSAGCTCHAPTRSSGRHWCDACFSDGTREAYRDRLSDAAPDLLEALDHPCLRELFGAIEDSGTKEADALWSRAVAWFDVRDAALKKARGE